MWGLVPKKYNPQTPCQRDKFVKKSQSKKHVSNFLKETDAQRNSSWSVKNPENFTHSHWKTSISPPKPSHTRPPALRTAPPAHVPRSGLSQPPGVQRRGARWACGGGRWLRPWGYGSLEDFWRKRCWLSCFLLCLVFNSDILKRLRQKQKLNHSKCPGTCHPFASQPKPAWRWALASHQPCSLLVPPTSVYLNKEGPIIMWKRPEFLFFFKQPSKKKITLQIPTMQTARKFIALGRLCWENWCFPTRSKGYFSPCHRCFVTVEVWRGQKHRRSKGKERDQWNDFWRLQSILIILYILKYSTGTQAFLNIFFTLD